jgi:hypothetical protein
MSGDRRRFTLAFFAYVIITFVFATVWHLVLFKDLYMAAGMRREPLMHLGILSMLIQAFLMAFLYPRLRGTGSPALDGLKFGVLMGLFMGSYGVLAEAGKFDVGPVGPFVAIEGAFFLLQFAIVGAVIGLVYGRGPAPAREPTKGALD